MKKPSEKTTDWIIQQQTVSVGLYLCVVGQYGKKYGLMHCFGSVPFQNVLGSKQVKLINQAAYYNFNSLRVMHSQ